ncbi:hypothetical protein RDI58_015084 [Solanum bulbocastanum]|uniref:Uncharacterized protein n=1 Tax=Solanum bulbocastanum TaxID=147425 RepID=A0AAN8TH41_SOLBU
MGPVDIAH